jgi:hypothetical protein
VRRNDWHSSLSIISNVSVQRRRRSVSFEANGESQNLVHVNSNQSIEASDLALLPDFDALGLCSTGLSNRDILYDTKKISTTTAYTINQLHSSGKIDQHLSPSDNAAYLLGSVLAFDMHDAVRAAINYALEVLKSTDPALTTVPVGLHPTKGARRSADDPQADSRQVCVLSWLVSSYTPISPPQPARKRHSLRGVADGVRFAVSMRDILSRPASAAADNVIFSAIPEMRAKISSALENVAEWNWDVAGLVEASQQRPLQTLGWELLHKWGLGKLCVPMRRQRLRTPSHACARTT